MDDVQRNGTEQPDEQESQRPVYAAINLRARAFLVDAIIVGGGVMALVVLSMFTEDVPGFGLGMLMTMYGLIFLYEPILVAARGATVGHRRANIMVVSDTTGGPPNFFVAFVRYLIKGVLGIPSFLGMAFTRRHQAVHDYLTGTTVQLRDASLARSYDFVLERVSEPPEAGSEPTRGRRIVAILLYLAGAWIVFNTMALALLSRGCRINDECSEIDRSNSALTLVVLVIAVVVIIVLGWKGRLPGARRVARQVDPQA